MPSTPVLSGSNVQELLPQLQSGDVLLFAGSGWTSSLVRLFTRSPWSHVAMVVRLPGYGDPLVLETTALNESSDLNRDAPIAGVVLVPLAIKLAEYPGAVAVRRRLGEPVSARQARKLERLVHWLRYRPYRDYVRAQLQAFFQPGESSSSAGLFCSELVAELYLRLGWMRPHVHSRNLVPRHFAESSLPLKAGIALAEACWLKPPQAAQACLQVDSGVLASGL